MALLPQLLGEAVPPLILLFRFTFVLRWLLVHLRARWRWTARGAEPAGRVLLQLAGQAQVADLLLGGGDSLVQGIGGVLATLLYQRWIILRAFISQKWVRPIIWYSILAILRLARGRLWPQEHLLWFLLWLVVHRQKVRRHLAQIQLRNDMLEPIVRATTHLRWSIQDFCAGIVSPITWPFRGIRSLISLRNMTLMHTHI